MYVSVVHLHVLPSATIADAHGTSTTPRHSRVPCNVWHIGVSLAVCSCVTPPVQGDSAERRHREDGNNGTGLSSKTATQTFPAIASRATLPPVSHQCNTTTDLFLEHHKSFELLKVFHHQQDGPANDGAVHPLFVKARVTYPSKAAAVCGTTRLDLVLLRSPPRRATHRKLITCKRTIAIDSPPPLAASSLIPHPSPFPPQVPYKREGSQVATWMPVSQCLQQSRIIMVGKFIDEEYANQVCRRSAWIRISVWVPQPPPGIFPWKRRWFAQVIKQTFYRERDDDEGVENEVGAGHLAAKGISPRTTDAVYVVSLQNSPSTLAQVAKLPFTKALQSQPRLSFVDNL